MPLSNASTQASPKREIVDDDFLTQHLSNLLVRQPSTSRAEHHTHLAPSSSTAFMSMGIPAVSRSCSLKHTLVEQSTSGPPRAPTCPSPPAINRDDIFNSFFIHQSRGGGDAVQRRASKSERLPARGSALSEPAHISGTKVRRRGSSSISNSTTFTGLQGVMGSIPGTEIPSDESSITSQSSRSSEHHAFSNSSNATGSKKTSCDSTEYPPGMLGHAKSVQYSTNETILTIPPPSSEPNELAKGSLALDWNPAFVKYSMRGRRPSMSLSTPVSSFSGYSPSTTSDPPIVTPSPPPPASSSSASEQRQREDQILFDEGEAIEPPDAALETPNLSDRVRAQTNVATPSSPCNSLSARHTSMTTRRTAFKRASVRFGGEETSAYGDAPSLESKSDVFGLNDYSGEGNRKQDHVLSSRRKSSVTLIPISDDGRTFRFVSSP